MHQAMFLDADSILDASSRVPYSNKKLSLSFLTELAFWIRHSNPAVVENNILENISGDERGWSETIGLLIIFNSFWESKLSSN